jgi:hypothetical protein
MRTGRGNRSTGRKLPQCHSAHHEFRKIRSGIEPGLQWRHALDWATHVRSARAVLPSGKLARKVPEPVCPCQKPNTDLLAQQVAKRTDLTLVGVQCRGKSASVRFAAEGCTDWTWGSHIWKQRDQKVIYMHRKARNGTRNIEVNAL